MNNIPSPLPTISDEWLERDIKRVGADKAPRVTPDDVKANIVSEFYFTAEEGVHASIALTGTTPGWPCEDVGALIPKPLRLLTFCVLVLRNGFTVTGGMVAINGIFKGLATVTKTGFNNQIVS